MSVGEVEGEGSLREASWARSDASVAEEVEEEAEAEAEEVSMEELSIEVSLEASDDEELREMQGAVARLREQLAVRRRHAEALLAEAHLSEHQQRKREKYADADPCTHTPTTTPTPPYTHTTYNPHTLHPYSLPPQLPYSHHPDHLRPGSSPRRRSCSRRCARARA